MAEVDVLVLGAGAAGLMCALTAGRRGRRVLVLDHADAAGKKILISGGGRCNFTNLGTTAAAFLSENPHFARSALGRYGPQDFLALVERHRIAWHEKTLGQLFCDGSARQIVAMLLDECAAAGVRIGLATRVTDVAAAGRFRVETTAGTVAAESLVVATGGPSIPKMGATGFAYEIARRFGLAVVPPRPALVPLTFGDEIGALCRSLAGLAVDVVAEAGGGRFREAMLFTHRGLSGPSILQVSSYWSPGAPVVLDLAPDVDVAAVLKARKRARPKAEARTMLADVLPARLAEAAAAGTLAAGALSGPPALPAGPVAAIADRAVEAFAAGVKRWTLRPTGSEGFAKAEVTAGGVATAGLSQKTLEAKAVPGLYFVGEAVDVTGWLGGYNFQWAWASGAAAGGAA